MSNWDVGSTEEPLKSIDDSSDISDERKELCSTLLSLQPYQFERDSSCQYAIFYRYFLKQIYFSLFKHEIFHERAHDGETMLKQRYDVIYVEITLLRRILTMLCPLGCFQLVT